MLEIKKITKIYETEGFEQKALDEVSINFRKNEFASILGPSGSGKTTLLNVIGGLDCYDSGDLVINETSTKEYKDQDWDTYRNHRVGFVFQSYNLIHHQSILANVELALTLSGVSKSERRKKALQALKEVGLLQHVNKRPNQLSGGQMQRVAIARALVNDPEILLADEPTGALDSQTSEQVMEILKQIAQDRLVIMVTHNPDLAQLYSTRIIRLKDGHIVDDTNPYDGSVDTRLDKKTEEKKVRKTSMGLWTALSLSLNNLMTKKGRTFLTAFAGSIGIIGIALILSLSNGVQEYIDRVQKETLSSYPLSIETNTIDFANMMDKVHHVEDITCEKNKICAFDDISTHPYLTMQSSMITNNLKPFKTYLDQNRDKLNNYTTDIKYLYDLDLHIYSKNAENKIVKVNPNVEEVNGMIHPMENGVVSFEPSYFLTNAFEELIDNESLFQSQYQMLSGRMPKDYHELILIVSDDQTIPFSLMYSLDIENREELKDILKKAANKEEIKLPLKTYALDDFVGRTYRLILNTDYYQLEQGKWVDHSMESTYLESLYEKGMELKIVGLAKVKEDATHASSGFIGYKHELVEVVMENINQKEIVKQQLGNTSLNVFTNAPFDGFTSSYQSNLKTLGIADKNNPSKIEIYPKDFESKKEIEQVIADYNDEVEEENQIHYTDLFGTLLSGITTIIDVISYVLIAFVSISLVVSSIMIAIITYISVLERTKEIGILRAIGASKKDITRVFRAETMIEGFIAGLLGIFITMLLCLPINAVVKSLFEIKEVASLPMVGALILIVISVLLTVLAGVVPSRIAAKKDPVEALRSE